MKKILTILMLICMGVSVYAINFPTYKPHPRDRQAQPNRPTMQRQETQAVGGYSTVATGGTTTTGEGSAVAGSAGAPRRAQKYSPDELNDGPYELGDWYVEGDNTYWWDPSANEGQGAWVDEKPILDTPGDPTPVGSPMVMLLFAAMACGAIYFRRRKAQA